MQVGHDQVGVEVEGKQSLKALVLLLGRLVDALVARILLGDGDSVGDLGEAVPDHPDVALTEDEDPVVFLENPHNTEGQGGCVAALYQLLLHQVKLSEQGEAPVQQGLHVDGLPGHVEQEADEDMEVVTRCWSK